jgi:hypothetical protein
MGEGEENGWQVVIYGSRDELSMGGGWVDGWMNG